MKKTKFNFIDWNNHVLLSSMKKIDLSIILIIILDSLFYFLSWRLVMFWLQRIQAKMASFNLPSDITSLGAEGIEQLVRDARLFLYLLIFSFVLVLIVIIFLASISKGLIWAKTTKTKISFALISKFLGLNLIWMGFWLMLVLLISFFFEPASVLASVIAVITLGFYFTNTLYTLFMKKQEFKSVIHAIRLNILKVHLFLLPYTIIFLLLFIILKIGSLLEFDYSSFAVGLVIVIFAAVVRYYSSTLVLEIEKLK